jgi:hypothetical protein
MNENTLLLRQINPVFAQPDGTIMSQAFNPTKEHRFQLSVYDGDQIDAHRAWQHFSQKLTSAGVMAVTGDECEKEQLTYLPDPAPFPEHALIDFARIAGSETPLSNGQRKQKAKNLRNKAIQRGWLFQAPKP